MFVKKRPIFPLYKRLPQEKYSPYSCKPSPYTPRWANMKAKRILVWFRNDLRLHDHPSLTAALQRAEHVYPVYCIDPRDFSKNTLGLPKRGAFRTKFLLEALQDLRQALQALGSNLIIRKGKPEEVLPTLAEMLQVQAIYTSQEVTQEELAVEQALEQKLLPKNIALESFWASTLVHIEDLPFPVGRLPDIFTDFRKQVEKNAQVAAPLPAPKAMPALGEDVSPCEIPSLADLGFDEVEASPKAVLDFQGGEQAGLARLREYLWKKDLLQNYKETRNGLLGGDYSSKFSPWLALGCLSPRKIHEEVKRYEQQRVKNQSTYWLIFELLWRDYFRFVAKKYGNRIFKKEGIRQEKIYMRNQEALFKLWAEGRTGVPFIDANMRELNATGFMSNRGRQNVASFLVKDLQVNWTWGAMYFESLLIDYDVCSNWGNWNYVAGVGNDPRENRYFNILSQAKKYDYQGEYVRHWLEELARVPGHKVHTVGDLSEAEQATYQVALGEDYPYPIVDYAKWQH
jgi:deoxyribodipyrimidine photo-lyase